MLIYHQRMKRFISCRPKYIAILLTKMLFLMNRLSEHLAVPQQTMISLLVIRITWRKGNWYTSDGRHKFNILLLLINHASLENLRKFHTLLGNSQTRHGIQCKMGLR